MSLNVNAAFDSAFCSVKNEKVKHKTLAMMFKIYVNLAFF